MENDWVDVILSGNDVKEGVHGVYNSTT